jgi:hypothetical protein
VRDGLMSDMILSLAASRNGDLWVGTPDGLNRIRGGRIESFTSVDGLPDDFIRSLLVDGDGSLWIGTRRGLAHWSPSGGVAWRAHSSARIQTLTQKDGLGSDLVGALARDAQGDLWVATFAGLSRLHNGSISNFTTSNGLSSNVLTALLPRSDGTLLIGTQDHGWDLWDGKRFSVAAGNGLERTTIHAILADARQSIWELRTQDSSEKTLPVKLRRIVVGAGGGELRSQFRVFEAYRPLPAETERELLRIAGEAIHNVKKHSGAKEMSVRLEYGPAMIDLEIRDDGRGGAPETEEASAPGHFGMTGMRERAASIGGTLEVNSVLGEGTVVRLRAPGPEPAWEQTGVPK